MTNLFITPDKEKLSSRPKWRDLPIVSGCLDILFPAHCVSCQKFGEWWCAECRNAAEYVHRDFITLPELDGLIVAGFYHDPKLRAVIHQLKYHGARCLIPSIASYCLAWRDARLDPWPWSGVPELAIQPLVGSPRRVRERGFDQAEIMTRIVCETLVPWARSVDLLQRGHAVQPQASIDPGPLRQANIAGAFSIRPAASIPSAVLLVDDVLTTGATMSEAARVLRDAGVKKIFGFALAIGK